MLCRSPVLWAIVGLQHYAGIYIALGTGLLQGVIISTHLLRSDH
jgi:hypothetical protein